ncbi:hypothetical protein LX16_4111 [Stackebrandtia albiflava]|uniref:Uncharacterized protein n=1 Tax=Stackebrandtia albiflava TaxID=406432 RepID=A0A562UYI0_9ACTN|nr:hypothetical protein [Stackebrandtia albiflava]TWJ10691.1 hypothetical protein LX16_4111 [Stackebrandtia albiflava]
MTTPRHILAILGCGLAAAAITVKQTLPSLPPESDYTIGYAPWWIGLAGAALGALTTLRLTRVTPATRPAGAAPSRVPVVAAWAAATLLLWSSAGVVLDGFRSFFALTGIPAGDFAVVDWPGYAARFLSLVACGAVLSVVVRHSRGTRGGCAECGTVPADRASRRVPGLVTIGALWPYPLLKAYWWLGGTVARPTGFDEGPPTGELLAVTAATLLCLTMIRPWWRRTPVWRTTLGAGWAASAALTSMGALSVFGTVSQLLGLTDGPVDFDSRTGVVMVSAVYGGWLAAGSGFVVLTWRFQCATRPACATCTP